MFSLFPVQEYIKILDYPEMMFSAFKQGICAKEIAKVIDDFVTNYVITQQTDTP